MTKRFLILGGGSAGLLAALSLKRRMPHSEVTVLYSSELGIIGVGEGTTPTMPRHLHGYLGLDMGEFYQQAHPTWKLGIRFEWGPRPYFNYSFRSSCDTQYQLLPRSTGFYCDERHFDLDISCAMMSVGKVFERQPNGSPFFGLDVSYHLENETFVSFLEEQAKRRGVRMIDTTVSEVFRNDHGITGLQTRTGETHTADLYVDCSGFRSLLLGETLAEPYIPYDSSLYCDGAIVGGWPRTTEPLLPYTVAETMDAGWCWQIEHEHRINRGYVFSSRFIDQAGAEREFREKNPRITQTRYIRFKTGRYERAWVKNVVAIGNASGFVEPLEATALGVIAISCEAVAETMLECGSLAPSPSMLLAYNHRNARSWDTIRQFLAIHYRFNTRLNTPFWRECREQVDLAGAEPIVEYFQENGPSVLFRGQLIHPEDQFKLDGYLCMLISQHVPYTRRHTISAVEWANVDRIAGMLKKKAAQAFTSEEALALIRRPDWQWNPDFYLKEYPHLALLQ